MFILPRFLRSALPAALLALPLAGFTPRAALAQSTALDTSFPIGLRHASVQPYSYTGRIFDVGDLISFGSGTLLRRHTVLTAGHVVFNATAGFLQYGTFNRGLYESYTFQKEQIIAVAALSGYQDAATTFGEDSIQAFSLDFGYVVVANAPLDSSWGNYRAQPTVLANPANQFFVLGYPGVTFDGRTMAYIVPSTDYVNVGPAGSGLFENDNYNPESGESGGPVYFYDGQQQYIAAETLGGISDTSGEFNATFVRAINKQANKFLTAAEYTDGLIRKVKIKGPRTVTHGTTVTYHAFPLFTVPNYGTTTGQAKTDRYGEIRLVTSTPGTSTQPAVTIQKINYTTFRVTFDASIRPNSATTISAFFSKTDPVPNSTITVAVQ